MTCACGRAAANGERYCGRCGRSLLVEASTGTATSAETGSNGVPAEGGRGQETTRMLCAAAHMHPEFADACIREYLVEPLRAVVHVPGVDAEAVLGDAVAADTRYRIRDALLLVCVIGTFLSVALFLAWPLLLTWFLVAVLHVRCARRTTPRRTARSVAGLVVGLLVLALPALSAAGVVALLSSTAVYPPTDLGQLLAPLFSTSLVALLLLLPATAIILIADELLTLRLVRRGFRRDRFGARTTGVVATLRGLGRARAARDMARLRATERPGSRDGAEVVVFRGPVPFIGTGELTRRRYPVIALESADDDGPPPAVSIAELHRAVRERVDRLARPSTLSPEQRLRHLRTADRILVSAGDLVGAWPSPDAATFLPRTDSPPVALAQPSAVEQQLSEPGEWARYYQLFQIEGWERDLTVSCHVTFGADVGLLYTEWTITVLPPVADAFRAVDNRRAMARFLLDRALTSLIRFPVSLLARFQRTFGLAFRPIKADHDERVADKYGAGPTIRELAAQDSGRYFHHADVRRYVGIFDQAIREGVRQYLGDHGLSVAGWERIVQNITLGDVRDSVVAVGPQASASSSTTAPAPPSPTPTGGS